MAENLARLQWLIRLRWSALFGVAVAGCIAAAGAVPGVNLPVVAVAVVLGVGFNLYVSWRAARLGDTDDRHVWQALLDTGALTLVLWAAGGADCPFIGFYVFPVLLASLLAGGEALWQTGAASAAGVVFQVATVRFEVLQVGAWNPPPPWDSLLPVAAITLTVGIVAYFAAVFTDALRQQVRARDQADAMLRLAFEGLDAGLEVVDAGRVAWQNPRAAELVGARLQAEWTCPCGGCDRPQCEFAVDERVYERHTFPLPASQRSMVLYLDRTTEVHGRRKLMLTERLASLGRTVQGVAHELNTPLATIQTMGRDVLDAVGQPGVPDAVRDDVAESAQMVVDEVQRCRRITHALLGRAEHLDPDYTGEASLSAAVDRALAVVFTHARERVQVSLGAAGQVRLPLDPAVQILVNLMQNAADADPGGTIEVSAELADGHVALHIRDHGDGLTAEAERHLFEPFHTTKPPGRGTGLGLYTSYALARGLGGDLSVANHPGGGAEAVFTAPSSPDRASE